MKRTQIYVEEELDRRIRAAALEEGRSAADLIREAVRLYLGETRISKAPDPFLALAGAFRGGPKDAAAEHDRYLYRPRASKKGRKQ